MAEQGGGDMVDKVTLGEYLAYKKAGDAAVQAARERGESWAENFNPAPPDVYEQAFIAALTEDGVTPAELARAALLAVQDAGVQAAVRKGLAAIEAAPPETPHYRVTPAQNSDPAQLLRRVFVWQAWLGYTGLAFGKTHPTFPEQLERAMQENGMAPTAEEMHRRLIRQSNG